MPITTSTNILNEIPWQPIDNGNNWNASQEIESLKIFYDKNMKRTVKKTNPIITKKTEIVLSDLVPSVIFNNPFLKDIKNPIYKDLFTELDYIAASNYSDSEIDIYNRYYEPFWDDNAPFMASGPHFDKKTNSYIAYKGDASYLSYVHNNTHQSSLLTWYHINTENQLDVSPIYRELKNEELENFATT